MTLKTLMLMGMNLTFSCRLPVAKENVTMRDIKKSFPLEGKYIFRFKYKVQNQSVWMDLNSDEAKVPLFNNRVFIKATRLDWNGIYSEHYSE